MLKKYIFVFLLGVSFKSYSNCELYDTGFHTIAVYLEDHPETFSKDFYPLNFHYENKKIAVHLSPDLNLLKVKQLTKLKQSCSADGSEVKFSLRGLEVVQTFPNCGEDAEDVEKNNGKVFYKMKDESIILPKRTILQVYDKMPPNERGTLEKNIVDFFKEKEFQASSQVLIKSNQYKVTSFSHFVYEGSKLVLSVANAETTLDEKKTLNFQAVFFSINGRPWYIADSSNKTPCEISENIQQEDESGGDPFSITQYLIDPLTTFKQGWIYGNSDYPQIIEFPESRYYIEFSKKMVVMDKLDSRRVNNQDTSFGLQKVAKKKAKK